jgi:hypothetical protein
MQAKTILPAIAALALVGATPAWSAQTAIGRISYIYPDGHRIILDAQDEYDIGPGVDANSLAVAKFVKLRLDTKDGRPVVTQVSPGPAALAGYWVGTTATCRRDGAGCSAGV